MKSDIIYATWFRVVQRTWYFAHWASLGSQNNHNLPGHLLAELTSVISCILCEFETKPLGRMRSASPSKKSKQGRSCNTGTEDLRVQPKMVTQVLRHLPPTINDVVTQNTTKIRYTLTISVLSSPPAPFSSFLLCLCLYSVCIPTGQFSTSTQHTHNHFRHFEYQS